MKFIANRSELLPIAKRCCLVIGRQFTTKETVCVLMEQTKTEPRAVHRAGKRMYRAGASALPGGTRRQSLAHRQRVSVHAGAVRGRSDHG